MMEDYYVEIFLGISIGAFIISLIFLISLIRANMISSTRCESVVVENKDQNLIR